MNYLKLLKFFREKKGIKQKDMNIDNKGNSFYSKIENGTLNLKYNDLGKILTKLDITFEEFSTFVDYQTPYKNFIHLYHEAIKNPSNIEVKNKLLEFFITDIFSETSTSKLNIYVILKIKFFQIWEEVPKINKKDIDYIFAILINKEFYSHYDYTLAANSIPYFNKRQSSKLISKMIPLSHLSNRDSQTKKYAFNILTNTITLRIYERDWHDAQKILRLAKKQDTDQTNYFFSFSLIYLENLIQYNLTHDKIYYDTLYSYIDLIEQIGDHKTANILKEEVKSVLYDPQQLEESIKNLEVPTTEVKEQ